LELLPYPLQNRFSENYQTRLLSSLNCSPQGRQIPQKDEQRLAHARLPLADLKLPNLPKRKQPGSAFQRTGYPQTRMHQSRSLRFLMFRMLATSIAKLGEFQLLRVCTLILCFGVVALAAYLTLQGDDDSG